MKEIIKGAEFSDDGKYRYQLWRIWNEDLPSAMCVGLNPSTANADKNDPTINNLTSVLTRLGFGGFFMTNLFGLVSSNPEDLRSCPDPVKDNDKYLVETAQNTHVLIFCWGQFKQAKYRVKHVEKLLERYEPQCFGKCKDGSPVHPMGLMWSGKLKTAELIPYFVKPPQTEPLLHL